MTIIAEPSTVICPECRLSAGAHKATCSSRVACAVCGCDAFVMRCLHCNAIPAAAPEAPQGDDAEVGGTCNVCGNGVRYGSRHHRCGAAIESAIVASRERERALREALCGLFAMIENGTLVRDTSRDNEPGWAMKQLPLVAALKAAEAALASPDSAAEQGEAK